MAAHVTRNEAGAVPSPGEIEATMRAEGLTPRRWGNAPGDTYAWHEHGYHKVLYCLAGSIVFHTRTDASKAATVHLIERLRACGFVLCDAQVPTDHLAHMGAIEIPRDDYLRQLKAALNVTAQLT